MTCQRFDRRLQELLDARQPPDRDPKLRAHAAHCPACRQILRIQGQLFRAFDGEEKAGAEPAVVQPNCASRERVCPTANRPSDRPSRPWFRLVRHPLIATALLVAFWWLASPMARDWERLPPSAPTQLAIAPLIPETSQVRSPAEPARPVAAIAAVPSDTNEGQVWARLVQWSNPTLATLGDLSWDSVAKVDQSQWMEPLREKLVELPRGQLVVVDELSEGMRPLAESLSAAMHVLLRSWSPRRENPRQTPGSETTYDPLARYVG